MVTYEYVSHTSPKPIEDFMQAGVPLCNWYWLLRACVVQSASSMCWRLIQQCGLLVVLNTISPMSTHVRHVKRVMLRVVLGAWRSEREHQDWDTRSTRCMLRPAQKPNVLCSFRCKYGCFFSSTCQPHLRSDSHLASYGSSSSNLDGKSMTIRQTFGRLCTYGQSSSRDTLTVVG